MAHDGSCFSVLCAISYIDASDENSRYLNALKGVKLVGKEWPRAIQLKFSDGTLKPGFFLLKGIIILEYVSR